MQEGHQQKGGKNTAGLNYDMNASQLYNIDYHDYIIGHFTQLFIDQ